jgi:hypothetical protein
MSVTYGDRTNSSRAQEILENEPAEIDPAPHARGPVTTERQPSDGELLARGEW